MKNNEDSFVLEIWLVMLTTECLLYREWFWTQPFILTHSVVLSAENVFAILLHRLSKQPLNMAKLLLSNTTPSMSVVCCIQIVVFDAGLAKLDWNELNRPPREPCCCGQYGLQYCYWPRWMLQRRRKMSEQVEMTQLHHERAQHKQVKTHITNQWNFLVEASTDLGSNVYIIFTAALNTDLWVWNNTWKADLMFSSVWNF